MLQKNIAAIESFLGDRLSSNQGTCAVHPEGSQENPPHCAQLCSGRC